MANEEKFGREEAADAGMGNKASLFKDDRAEDIGAIIITVIIVVAIMFLKK